MCKFRQPKIFAVGRCVWVFSKWEADTQFVCFFRCFSYTISTLTMSLREVTLSMYYYFDGKWNDLIRIFYEWCNVFVIHRLTASVKQRVRLKILTFNRCRYFAKQICHLNYSELTCMSSTSVLISTTQIGSDQFTSGWFN